MITTYSLEAETIGEKLDQTKTWRFHEPRVYFFAENEEGELWFTNYEYVVAKINCQNEIQYIIKKEGERSMRGFKYF